MTARTNTSAYQNILKFAVLLRPYWKNIIIFILTGLILTLLSLPYPWLTKLMIDDVMLRQDHSLLYVILIRYLETKPKKTLGVNFQNCLMLPCLIEKANKESLTLQKGFQNISILKLLTTCEIAWEISSQMTLNRPFRVKIRLL
jgi:ABC-type multidrug transport system fused ATPase/permease subunit